MSARRARAKELKEGQVYQLHSRKYGRPQTARRKAITVRRMGRRVLVQYAYEILLDDGSGSFRRQRILPVDGLDCNEFVWLHEE
jgi:hypothetical protein